MDPTDHATASSSGPVGGDYDNAALSSAFDGVPPEFEQEFLQLASYPPVPATYPPRIVTSPDQHSSQQVSHGAQQQANQPYQRQRLQQAQPQLPEQYIQREHQSQWQLSQSEGPLQHPSSELDFAQLLIGGNSLPLPPNSQLVGPTPQQQRQIQRSQQQYQQHYDQSVRQMQPEASAAAAWQPQEACTRQRPPAQTLPYVQSQVSPDPPLRVQMSMRPASPLPARPTQQATVHSTIGSQARFMGTSPWHGITHLFPIVQSPSAPVLAVPM